MLLCGVSSAGPSKICCAHNLFSMRVEFAIDHPNKSVSALTTRTSGRK